MKETGRVRVVWKDGKCIRCTDKAPAPGQSAPKTAAPRQTAPRHTEARRPKSLNQNVKFGRNSKKSDTNMSIFVCLGLIVLLSIVIMCMVFPIFNMEMPGFAHEERVVQSESEELVTESVEPVIHSTPAVIEDPVPAINEGYAVCIDPGHGFYDPGTGNEALNVYEDEVVLRVGFKLREKLEERGVKVYMTHDTNEIPEGPNQKYILSLSKRNDFANSLSDVDFYISIHCNAFFEDENVKGARIYHMNDDEGGRAVSRAFANIYNPDSNFIVNEMSGMNSYQVIRNSDMPAVLVETGFVSNPDEAKAMLTDEWTDSMAEMLCESIMTCFKDGSIG